MPKMLSIRQVLKSLTGKDPTHLAFEARFMVNHHLTFLGNIFLSVLITGLSACSFSPRLQETQAVAGLPASFDQDPEEGATSETLPAQLNWWTSFNDPTLNALVDSSLARNLDLRMATARVREVQNQYRIARSPLFPSIQAGADGTRSSTPANTGSFGSIGNNIPGFPDRFENVIYSASLGLSYELDFWGRNRNTAGAALNEFYAAQADRQTAQIGVVSETIATYFEISALEKQVAYAQEIVDLLLERTELSEDRYQRGLITSFELYTIRQAYETERANLPLLESALYEAKGRLAIILGSYVEMTDTWLGADRQAELTLASIPAGLPSTLLKARPDVYAAEKRMEAAARRIGVAQAARFPSFSLTATGGTQSSDLSKIANLSTQNFSNLIGSIAAPIFQGGRLKADVEVARAQYDQISANYEKTVLTSIKEVNAALLLFEKEKDRYAFLVNASANAESSEQNQENRYTRGIGDYLAYIDARVNRLRTTNALEASRQSLANAQLALHRALGGGWVDEASP